jgi:hypothetical protein
MGENISAQDRVTFKRELACTVNNPSILFKSVKSQGNVERNSSGAVGYLCR